MDICDKAKLLEQQQRNIALARALQRPPQVQQSINDEAVCEDCFAPIPAARLAVLPRANRCIDCQSIKERHEQG
ncbi:TraR/DksA C4-type zinc finger protein [Agarivorans sp. QJM3NY_25]|uniref:TraR/DksA C4-type zinc finger protein n=1 Tax=Agarivorans sp. QJM3NY_25 TaxID=3421430 RepID=UPI003D7E4DBF